MELLRSITIKSESSSVVKNRNSCLIKKFGCYILKRIVRLIRHFYWKTTMKPSEALSLHRAAIRILVEINGAQNPRVFGSVLHGEDTVDSDLDLLVDPIDGKTTLTSIVRIKREIEALTGISIDVLTPMALHERFRQTVLAEAMPI